MFHNRQFIATLIVLVFTAFLTCMRDTAYNPADGDYPVGCAAFITSDKITPESIPDSSEFSIIDTFHTLDTVTFAGLILPFSDEVQAHWEFGDNTGSDSALCSHVYTSGGIYTAVFTIRDLAGFSISDTVIVHINTVPSIPRPLLPEMSKEDVNPEVPLLFRWSGDDPDGDDLSFIIRLDTVNPPLSRISVMPDTEFNLEANSLQKLTDYYWGIMAVDKYNDSSFSNIRMFRTRDPHPPVTGSLSGVVLREGGINSGGILVSAIRNDVVIATDLTDSSGLFIFDNLASGSITIVFTDNGLFSPETVQTAIIAGKETQTKIKTLLDIDPPELTLTCPSKVKAGEKIPIHYEATDTFYGIDSITANFGDGFIRVISNDTVLDFSSPGTHKFHFRAYDSNGNISKDSITVRVNSPPEIPSLVAPTGYADLNTGLINLRWTCLDEDDSDLHYDILMKREMQELDNSTPYQNMLDDTSFEWTATAKNTGVYYWRIRAFDGFDTSISPVDSFRISQGTGIITGYVLRQAMEKTKKNSGIQVSASKSGVIQSSVQTDSSGAYTLKDLSGTVTIIARNYGFRPDSVTVVVVNGITVKADTMTLLDSIAPVFQKSDDATVKSGASVPIQFSASDTLYSVDSLLADFGDGFRTTSGDTAVTYSTPGNHRIYIRAVDANGNTRNDSINVHVNYPPQSLQLKSPLPGASVEVNSNPVFSWGAKDNDNRSSLRYDLFIGTSRSLDSTDRIDRAMSDSSYMEWNSGNISRPYYWKVVVYDGYDTLASAVDSFNVGHFTIGYIYGWAKREGVRRHNGIRVSLNGTVDYLSLTDGSGFCAVEVEPGTYSIIVEDTLRTGFNSAAGNITVLAGDSASFDTLILEDQSEPVITCTSPSQGALLRTLDSRTLTISGEFSDSGSQVHLGSVKVHFNGEEVSGVNRTLSGWQFAINNIPDGHHTVSVNANDSAGNKAAQLVRTFTVNSKTISAQVSFHHDTLYCTTTVANALPDVRAYYWNFDKHADASWDDSTLTELPGAAIKWAFPDPAAAGTDTLIVMAVDDSGMAVYDTLPYVIVDDLPVVHAGNDSTVAMNSSIALHGWYDQQFGKAVRYDWSINGSGFSRTSTADTVINVPDQYYPAYKCILQVTDDRGNVVRDTLMLTVGKTWQVIGGTGIAQTEEDGNFALGVYSDNEMYLACKDPSNSYKIKVLKWNGTSWITEGAGFSSGKPAYIQIAVGSGFGSGGGFTYSYSAPYVAFSDFGDSKTKVFKPGGDSVGTFSLINGWTNPVSFIVPGAEGSTAPCLAYSDHSNSNRVRVKKFANGYGSNDWDTVGTFASASSAKVRDLAADISNTYVLVRGSMADTLKRLNMNTNAWQSLASFYFPSNPAITIHNGELYYADKDGSFDDRITVRRYTGSGMAYVGEPVSDRTVSTHFSGTVGMIGIQSMGSVLMVAYCEYDETGNNPELRIKSWDGTTWRTVGEYGLPSGAVDISRASFTIRKNKPYIAYRSGSELTVLGLH